MVEKLYYTAAEICEMYRISRTTLWRLSQEADCPTFARLDGGGKLLVPAKAFDEFFRSRLQPSVPSANRDKKQEKASLVRIAVEDAG